MSAPAFRQLSPLRNTTELSDAEGLAAEQAAHFGIDAESDYGRTLIRLAASLYDANAATHELMKITMEGLKDLDRNDRLQAHALMVNDRLRLELDARRRLALMAAPRA